MAPKAKKGKKAQDDWDDDLGEAADPVAQAEAEAKAEEAPNGEDDAPAGGLMAALRKNKEKRKKKGKAVDNDWLDGEDPPQEAPPTDLATKAPVEASMEDEELFAEPAKKGKGGKKQPVKQEEAGSDDDGTGRVKTKAEKEKERKEREKQRKKEQAAAKKKSTPAPPPPEKEEAKPEPVEAAPIEPPAAGSKKKKVPAALAALQKQQDDLRRQRELSERAKAEEEARLAEEQQRLEEEEKRKAELKAAKKEREKKKIEEQKRAGTYKTDKQKRDDAQAKLRLQQMLESGTTKVAGIDGDEEPKAKKDDKKKRNPRKEAEERKAQQAREEEQRLLEIRLKEDQAKRAEEEAEKARKNAEEKKQEEKEESEDEDWEALAAKDEVQDSWDASDDGKATNGASNGVKDDEDEDEDDDSDEDSDDSDSDHETVAERQARERKEQAHARRQKELEAARAAASTENLRSPIACVMGHVDTGKTSLLDHIRSTSVQAGEAGGITQQIGATYFPAAALRAKTAVVNKDGGFEMKVPGLLIIDTPGHESFSNLRSRGSSLCNIAILVVDIMHGLEPQTLESMKMLRDRKTPFLVALNKIDRMYDWKAVPNNGFRESLAVQKHSTQSEFADRLQKTKLAFSEQGFNAEVFYENRSMAKNVSLVPTSAHTGEGIPDLLKLLVTLTQERMTKQLMYVTEVEATVLEVKVVEGFGTTIDVILINGVLNVGDKIVLCGTEGAISTDIRALLTPAEMKELRLKSAYVHNHSVKAALGVKIAAQGLENAVAGSRLLVAKDKDDEDEIEDLEEEVMGDLEQLMSRLAKTGRGVSVNASTLGALEALLSFLADSKIPVANIGIGNVYKRDIITASSMLEKAPDYALMLAFDVKIDPLAAELAQQVGVKIFTADIIYHLFDAYTAHIKEQNEQRKEDSKMLAVFPCVLRPVAVFNKRDPIVIGVDVIEGTLRMGTPLAVVKQNPVTKVKEVVTLGRVSSAERDHKALTTVKKGAPSVAVKIEGSNQPYVGRQWNGDELIYSQVSRASIDVLKNFFRDEVSKDDWTLIAKTLKPLFDVA